MGTVCGALGTLHQHQPDGEMFKSRIGYKKCPIDAQQCLYFSLYCSVVCKSAGVH